MMSKKKLSPKQKSFVAEYIKDKNATQAAIRAGYSKKTARQQGDRLLSKVDIADAVDKKLKKLADECLVDAKYVIDGFIDIAERCRQARPVVDRSGKQVFVETPEGDMRPAYTFDAAGANKALECLGRHLKLFIDRTEVTGKDGEPLYKAYEGIDPEEV